MIPNRWRRPAAMAWLVLVGLTLAAFVAGIPARADELRQVCLQPEAVCHETSMWRPTASDAAALQADGLSLAGYATLEIAKWVVFSSIWIAVGGLIFARKSGEWMALVVAYFLATFPAGWDGIPAALIRAYPAVWLPAQTLQYLASCGLLLFMSLFPNGRFVPRWTLWAAVLTALASPLWPFLPAPWQPPGPIQLALRVGVLALLVIGQVVRYRRYSSPAERERTRWVVFGLCLGLVLFSIMVSTVLFGALQYGGGPLERFVTEIFYQVSVAIFPLSIGVAILRSRLFDIDVLIRRTLIYAILSGLLALAYFGTVVVLQKIFGALTGQSQSALVTVLSTLVIAALFVPLRVRVQAVIDRRLYRRKYDAARTLSAFGAALRDDVDLSRLSEHLVDVVDETMQPASVGLWLANRPPGRAPERPV